MLDDRFVGVERGRPLPGSRAIAEYLLGDADKSEIVCALLSVSPCLVSPCLVSPCLFREKQQ